MATTEILNATKKRAKQTQGQKTKAQAIILWSIKRPINSTLFDAQNSELLEFFFLGGMPPDPPRDKGPCGPFNGHSRLLHLQWPLITNVIVIYLDFHSTKRIL